jgi:imidazolonepropionase-like amidohydrolase
MERAGMSPSDVLVASTSRAAELLGWRDRLGMIEPGKLADMVVVEGDPLELATLADRIRAVYMDGRLVSGAVD